MWELIRTYFLAISLGAFLSRTQKYTIKESFKLSLERQLKFSAGGGGGGGGRKLPQQSRGSHFSAYFIHLFILGEGKMGFFVKWGFHIPQTGGKPWWVKTFISIKVWLTIAHILWCAGYTPRLRRWKLWWSFYWIWGLCHKDWNFPSRHTHKKTLNFVSKWVQMNNLWFTNQSSLPFSRKISELALITWPAVVNY